MQADLDATSAINLHQPECRSLLLISGQRRNCDVCACGAVRVDEVLVVHPVQVVTWPTQDHCCRAHAMWE